MRTIKLLASLLILVSLSIISCKVQTPEANENGNSYTGTIAATGITTYQYGSHTLSLPNSSVFYALRSSSLDLDKHIGKSVKVITTQIEGYPVDGGPLYFEVHSVQ